MISKLWILFLATFLSLFISSSLGTGVCDCTCSNDVTGGGNGGGTDKRVSVKLLQQFEIKEEDWEKENFTRIKYEYQGYTFPDDLYEARKKAVLDPRVGGIEGITTIIDTAKGAVEAVFGIFNFAKETFQNVHDMIKTSQDIIKLLGFDKKDDILLFDIACPKCRIWMKCHNWIKRFEWVEIEPEFGGILKFSTRIPHDWNLIGLDKWRCTFRDDNKGKREVTVDVFGGKAPKYAINLIKVKDNRIFAVDVETNRIDVAFTNVYW